MQQNFSLSQFDSFQQFFLTGLPQKRFLYQGDEQGHGEKVPDYPKQIASLLDSCLEALQDKGFADNVVMSNFFLADISKKELVRQLLLEKGISPKAATFIPQAPADGYAVAVEIWAMKNTETKKKTPFRWFFSGDARSEKTPVGAYERSLSAFENVGRQLQEQHFSIGQLLRTWIYQGHLVLPEGDTQRYKELNRARTNFFDGVLFLQEHLPAAYRGIAYPASTGIGADDADVVIAAVALATDRDDVVIVPLENPNQISAFDYGEVYSPQSPKFSRAVAVAADNSCLVFVSGTASITESESRHSEDPTAQTETTLDNIAALIDRKNLERHGIKLTSPEQNPLETLQSVRVYVKRLAELELIKNVCEKRLGNVPVLYTIADVCRPELLVEIEGIAVISG